MDQLQVPEAPKGFVTDAAQASTSVTSKLPKPRSKWWKKYQTKCEDGGRHDGKLELITWESIDDGEKLGWGACLIDESADLKHMYETNYGSDDAKFYEYWPQGFRWTCCGGRGDNPYGCDHHGTGSTPCKCDFCVMGRPVPSHTRSETYCRGLKLSNGPHVRSGNPMVGSMNAMMRQLLGMGM